ncbi:hypothetical protein [Chroococcidiopsis sp. CCNUC1]|nr:hypothetical protein [Chroococcidiopsis sp. CCNUC1]
MSNITSPPIWWNDLIIDFTLAYDALIREHESEVISKQLLLWEPE